MAGHDRCGGRERKDFRVFASFATMSRVPGKTADKQDVNLAICGHAWHGKSTLVGKTVAELGMIGRRELQQYEDLAAKGRDASLVFALLVFRQKDVTHKTDEAARGITVLPSFVRFEFPKHRVTVI